MTSRKAAAYFVLATVSAAWFASAVGMPPQSQPSRNTPPPATDEAALDMLARDVQAQSARLRERLATAAGLEPPVRNPFSFGRRDVPQRGPVSPPTADVPTGPAPEPVPREPMLALIGVAEQNGADGLVRTAMISEDGEELHMATPGETVAGIYVVVTVSVDAVELKHLSTGATRRLVLR